MRPLNDKEIVFQFSFEASPLINLIKKRHPLVILADQIDWISFDESLKATFCENNGRPAISVRLMVGLHYLKYMYNLSDRSVVEQWVENPYWQYFCGASSFEHEPPIDPSSMTRWRKRLKDAGAEQMLAESIKTGLRQGFIHKKDLKRVNVDTTVQEKDIRYPTDARLYDRMREKLVKAASERKIRLRQSYSRLSKQALRRQSGYGRAKQFKRARKQTRKLKTYLGRVVRDIDRKTPAKDIELSKLLEMARRLLHQKTKDKKKLYSINEPDTECISKGKVHKRYEFGNKVGLVTSAKKNWILGALAFHGNPYDGHTLEESLEQVERNITEPDQAVCDMGYRKHNYTGKCDVQIVRHSRKRLSRSMKRWWNRRSAIEPVIGHMKQDNRLGVNRLHGQDGDRLNVILSACGFNMCKLLRAIAQYFLRLFLEECIHFRTSRVLYRCIYQYRQQVIT